MKKHILYYALGLGIIFGALLGPYLVTVYIGPFVKIAPIPNDHSLEHYVFSWILGVMIIYGSILFALIGVLVLLTPSAVGMGVYEWYAKKRQKPGLSA